MAISAAQQNSAAYRAAECTAPVIQGRYRYNALHLLVAFAFYANLARVAVGSRYVVLLADGLLFALAGYTLSIRLLSGKRVSAVEWLVASLLVIGALSTLHPNIPNLMAGIEGFRQTLFQMLAVIIGVALLNSRERLLRFIQFVAILAIPVLLWAIKQFFWISPLDLAIIEGSTADIYTWQIFGKVRAFGFFSGPFHMGLLAGFVFWIAIACYIGRRGKGWLLLAVVCFLACLATLTRGSLIAMCVTLPVVLFIVMRTARFRVAVATTVVLTLLVVGAFVLAEHVDAVGSVVRSLSTLNELSDDTRLAGRFDGYQEGLAAVATNPFGIGMGASGDALDHYFDPYKHVHITSHNMLLRVALETGWLGLALFLGILAQVVLAVRRLAAERQYDIAVLAGGCLGIMLITGITGSSINAFPVNLVFWLIAGSVVSLTSRMSSAEDR